MTAEASPAAVVLLGVSGSGKTTVGIALADRLGWRFEDGDAFHSAANRAKMAAGEPLTDADRAPWLAAIANRIAELATAKTPVVLACSGLKRRYRDVLRANTAGVVLVLLDVSREQLRHRLDARTDHFFPPELLDSQLSALEQPTPDENVLTVNADADTETTISAILARLPRKSS